MTITMTFDRLATKDNKPGAFFKGRVYGQKRSVSQFYTIEGISDAMRDAKAKNPNSCNLDTKWTVPGHDKSGQQIIKGTLITRELNRALEAHSSLLADKFKEAANKLDAIAERQHKAALNFFMLIPGVEGPEVTARFIGGRKAIDLTLDDVRERLSEGYVQTAKAGFIPEPQLFKARAAFLEHGKCLHPEQHMS